MEREQVEKLKKAHIHMASLLSYLWDKLPEELVLSSKDGRIELKKKWIFGIHIDIVVDEICVAHVKITQYDSTYRINKYDNLHANFFLYGDSNKKIELLQLMKYFIQFVGHHYEDMEFTLSND